jgi:aldose 1-epimerase
MSLTKSPFGVTPGGQNVEQFHLSRDDGFAAHVSTYGACLTQLHVPHGKEQAANIVLGFDNLKQYLEQNDPYFGVTVGRVANRIAHGAFVLDGRQYTVAKNDGAHALHGGVVNFSKVVWKAEGSETPDGPAVRLSYHSPDGQERYPGNVDVTVTYTLTADRALRIDYNATTDKPTPINLTNHSYFNLAGAGNGDILDHLLIIAADEYTPTGKDLIPTGQIASVHSTPLDFTTPHPIGERIAQVSDGTLAGYDNNYVLNNPTGKLIQAARLEDPKSGRVMITSTTQPAVQLYTANFLDGSWKGNGGAYVRHGGVCLETQHYPDSVHHTNFPSTILRVGQTYRHRTEYRFE